MSAGLPDVDDRFELLDFRYEAVVLGLVSTEWDGRTVTLKLP